MFRSIFRKSRCAVRIIINYSSKRTITFTKEKPSTLKSKFAKSSFWTSIAFVPVVNAFGFGQSKKDQTKSSNDVGSEKNPEIIIIEESDTLYSKNDVEGLYQHLVLYKESNNADILWRLCRAACDKAKSSQDKNEKKQLMYEAFEYIKKALAMNENISAVHKWYAIMLDYVAEYEGTKVRITNAFKVKEHFLKAIQLNPKDATSVHLLGYWCFIFADLPWYQQKIAAALFASPPSSTYEEALSYFEQAEKIDPNFFSTNLLYLGKTHLRLKNYDVAKCYLARTLQYPVKTPDDKQAHTEAEELMRKL